MVMSFLTRCAIALAVCVLFGAAHLLDGPTEDETAALVAEDAMQAPIDAAQVARGE